MLDIIIFPSGLTGIKKLIISLFPGSVYYSEICISDKGVKMKNRLEEGTIVEKNRMSVSRWSRFNFHETHDLPEDAKA